MSATKNGNAVPLYESCPRYTAQPALCYVLPSNDAKYEQKSISFSSNGLSEHVWYALVCRSTGEKQGLMLDDKDAKPRSAAIPESGDYAEFQWRLQGDQLINRAYPAATIKLSSGSAGLTPVANKGTDCFSLDQVCSP